MKDYRNGMTTQEYRESYDYRREYFKRNPGIFGKIWVCSQCGKLLIGKKNVYVDHIMPLNQGGINNVRNCTAICRSCNLSKSDKVDYRVIKGRRFKFFEQLASDANRGIGAAALLGLGAATAVTNTTAKVGVGAVKATGKVAYKGGRFALRTVWRTATGLVKRAVSLVTYPVRKGSLLSRLVMLFIYCYVIFWLLSEKTSLLDFLVK